MAKLSPRLNKPEAESAWLNRPGAPKREKIRSKPMTIPYAELIQQWK
jgi:hypothetical protein